MQIANVIKMIFYFLIENKINMTTLREIYDKLDNNQLLSVKNKHPFDSMIKFQEEGHKYWINGDDTDLVSCTTYIHNFFSHFDSDKCIANIMNSFDYRNNSSYKYYKMTKKQIEDMWEENRKNASEEGTKLHANIEYFYNGLNVENDSPEFKQFLDFFNDHKHLEIYRTEWCIFSEIFKITGSIDAVFKNSDGTYTIGDWKRCKKIDMYPFNENDRGKFPFQHLPDCNFYHYSLQLNLYRVILENFYGLNIKDMFLVVCHPDNKNNKYIKINIKRMDKEGEYLLRFRRRQLLELNYDKKMFSSMKFNYKLPSRSDLEIFEEEINQYKYVPLMKRNKNEIKNEINIKKNKIMTSELTLSKKQQEAYDLIIKGKNVFLTGAGGSGKTLLIKYLYKKLKDYREIALTSTTGTSAILIGGTTLHSYLGIGLGKLDAKSLLLQIRRKSWILKRWKTLDILVIDEISMLSPVLFDKLEYIARNIRKNERPFGGIQLILSGDFYQLPVVGESNTFCFNAESWKYCIQHTIYFTENFRQDDFIFQQCLNEIRVGKVSQNTLNILKSRENKKLENTDGILPTKIFSLNVDVDEENENELNKLVENNPDLEFFEYEMQIEVLNEKLAKDIEEKIKKVCMAPFTLQLCVGAQVMLLYNLELENKLCNGSRGIVIRFENDLPVVKFVNGVTRTIDTQNWEIYENDEIVVSWKQIPLKVAYACSSHKVQGMSIDYAEVDLANIFEYGQAYVALSRVRTLEGLSIKNFNKNCIKANPKVTEYYNNLEKEQENDNDVPC